MLSENADVSLYLSGNQVLVKKCNVVITQPSIKQVCMIGETTFLTAVELISKSQELFKEVREKSENLRYLGDFAIMMTMLDEQESMKNDFMDFLSLICPNYKIEISKTSIKFYIDDEVVVGMVNESNFNDFKEITKDLFSLPVSGEQEFNPANDAAKKIADKILEARKRIKKDSPQKQSNVSLFSVYISILSIGLAMDMNIFFSYTPFQLYDAFSRYKLKLGYDFYQKASMVPFADTSKLEKPEEWTKSLYTEDESDTGAFTIDDIS